MASFGKKFVFIFLEISDSEKDLREESKLEKLRTTLFGIFLHKFYF